MRKFRMILLAILLIAMTCLVPACGAGGQEEVIEEEPPVVNEKLPVINEKKDPSEYDDGQEFSASFFNESNAKSVNTSGVDIPKEEFLYDLILRYIGFSWNKYYDANEPTKKDHYNIMAIIASDDMINTDTYKLGEYHEVKEGDDPRGWSKESDFMGAGSGSYGYSCADRAAADWLAENIFNVSADGIKEAVEAAEREKILYLDGDKYYGFLKRSGLGNPGPLEIRECKQDGNVYYMAIDYDLNEQTTTAYVKAELKNIDGIWYWTLHSITEDRPPELS